MEPWRCAMFLKKKAILDGWWTMVRWRWNDGDAQCLLKVDGRCLKKSMRDGRWYDGDESMAATIHRSVYIYITMTTLLPPPNISSYFSSSSKGYLYNRTCDKYLSTMGIRKMIIGSLLLGGYKVLYYTKSCECDIIDTIYIHVDSTRTSDLPLERPVTHFWTKAATC